MKDSIVIFATAWGAGYGGINSFNTDLCIALADLLKSDSIYSHISIVCILSKGGTYEITSARSSGIECRIIPCIDDPELDKELVTDCLCGAKVNPVYVLGHDVYTGQRAIDLAKHHGVISAVFHHMSYRVYKPNDKEANNRQKSILKGSNIVFAVGPTLKASAQTILTGITEKVCIEQVLPGITSRNIADKPPPNFSAITLGRVNLENDLVKQIKLAVASFGRAVSQHEYLIRNKEPSLTVIGISEDDLEKDQDSLQKLADERAECHVSLGAWTYEKDRTALFDELSGKTVCMVLSWYEGFSLVGLEAISIGIPLILSKKTGLYEAVDDCLQGGGTGRLYPVDISALGDIPEKDLNQVVKKLSEIASDPQKAKDNALALRGQLLDKKWTWEETAKKVLSKLELQQISKEEVEEISEGDNIKWLKAALKQLKSITQSSQEENQMGTVIHIEDFHQQSVKDRSFQAIQKLRENYMLFKEGSRGFPSCRREDPDISSSSNALEQIQIGIHITWRLFKKIASEEEVMQYEEYWNYLTQIFEELKTITNHVYHQGNDGLDEDRLNKALGNMNFAMKKCAESLESLLGDRGALRQQF
jgi:glycosyltransferase involved in cell wall biosynthesis